MRAKTLLLGTAAWGWTVSRLEAFRLLDGWLAAGYRHIDAATNYPINKNPADFRAAEKILEEYLRAHGIRNLAVTMKIGALDNLRSPDVNLSPSFILMMAEEYRRLLGDNLQTVMLHWDNRTEEVAIRESLRALALLEKEQGIRPGLSGIRRPDLYARLNREFGMAFDIQLKHNVLHTDLDRYNDFLPDAGAGKIQHRFFAYGINAGGLKLEGPYPAGSTYLVRGGDPEKTAEALQRLHALLPKWNTAFVRPPLRTMNHLGLVFAGLEPRLDGIVLGLRSVEQLQETLDFWRNLDTFDYSDVFSTLLKITKP